MPENPIPELPLVHSISKETIALFDVLKVTYTTEQICALALLELTYLIAIGSARNR